MTGPRTYAFASVAEIRDLAARAFAAQAAAEPALHSYSYGPDAEVAQREASLASRAAIAALVFCSQCIAYLRDPALVGLAKQIVDVLEEQELFDSDAFAAIRELAATGRVTAELAELVDVGSDALRKELAAGLRPDTTEGAALLAKLCDDPSSFVRATARERLSKFAPMQWWSGAFSADPLAGVDPAQAERLRPAVEELAGHLAQAHFNEALVETILTAAEKLPPAIGADAAGRVLEAVGSYRKEIMPRAAKLLAAAGEAGAKMVARLEHSAPRALRELIPAYVAELEPAQRHATLCAWLQEAATDGPQGTYDDVEHARLKAVQDHWPLEADPTPLLECALARAAKLSDTDWDTGLSQVASALGDRARPEVLAPRIVPEVLRGLPHKLSAIERGYQAALARLPKAELRELVERALRSPAESCLSWAIEQRIEALFEPATDGTVRALAERLDDDPAVRKVMRERHLIRVLPRARRELVAGKLPFLEAAKLVDLVGRLWGGALGMALVRGNVDQLERPPLLVEHREKFAAYLDPAPEGAPPTAAEWAALRAARAASTIEKEEDFFIGLMALPPDPPLESSDRAFVDRAIEAAPRLASDRIFAQLGWVLASCGEASDRAVLTRLERACTGVDEDEAWARGELRVCQAHLAKRLGPLAGPKLKMVRSDEA